MIGGGSGCIAAGGWILGGALAVLLVGLVSVWLHVCYAGLSVLVGSFVYVLSSWVWVSSGPYLVCLEVLSSFSCSVGSFVSPRAGLAGWMSFSVWVNCLLSARKVDVSVVGFTVGACGGSVSSLARFFVSHMTQ